MPQHQAPNYTGPHELIEQEAQDGGYVLRCIRCDRIIDPADVSAHLALNDLPKA